MGKFIFWTFVFLIAGGLIIHFEWNLPYFSSWFGKLPGDFLVKKGDLAISFPIVSSVIISLSFSLILSALFKKKREK